MTIAELEEKITAILNRLIADPTLVEYTEPEYSAESSLEIQRMESEIERRMEATIFDKNEIQELILKCASKKYDENKSLQHITDRLKADFEKSSPLSVYSHDLLERTISSVIMSKDKSIQLQLKNGKIIREGLKSYAEANSKLTENSQGHPTQARVFQGKSA